MHLQVGPDRNSHRCPLTLSLSLKGEGTGCIRNKPSP